MPDSFGSFPGNLAVDVDDCRRPNRRNVSSVGARVFLFLSIPTMVAATGYDLLKSLRGTDENPIGVSRIDSHGWVLLAVGFVVSFIVAYGAVAWFMAWVRRRGFTPFAIYRIIVGAAVLFWGSKLAGG